MINVHAAKSFCGRSVYFNKKEFPKEIHWSSFAPGQLKGMEAYFDYQYYDVDRLLAYLEMLQQKYTKLYPRMKSTSLGIIF